MYLFNTQGEWSDYSYNRPGARFSFYYIPYFILGKSFSKLCNDSDIFLEIYNQYNSSISKEFYYKFCENYSAVKICEKENTCNRELSAIYRSLEEDMRFVGLWLSRFQEFNSLISQLQSLIASKYDLLQTKPTTRAEWYKFRTKCFNDLETFTHENLKRINPLFLSNYAKSKSTGSRR